MRKNEVVVAENGRDAGKHFKITEWPSAKADEWGNRMVLALVSGSRPLPFPVEALFGRGMEAIFVVGLQTVLTSQANPDVLIPLVNQLLECVTIVRDPNVRSKETGDWIDSPITSPDDIEEVSTRWWLREKVFKLHTGFSMAEAFSKLGSLILTTDPVLSQETT